MRSAESKRLPPNDGDAHRRRQESIRTGDKGGPGPEASEGRGRGAESHLEGSELESRFRVGQAKHPGGAREL